MLLTQCDVVAHHDVVYVRGYGGVRADLVPLHQPDQLGLGQIARGSGLAMADLRGGNDKYVFYKKQIGQKRCKCQCHHNMRNALPFYVDCFQIM